MNDCPFLNLAKKHFQFLVDQYGFSIVEERYYPESFGNAIVTFRSKAVTVRVVLDRGQVLLDVGPRHPIKEEHGLAVIADYLGLKLNEPIYEFPETWDSPTAACEMQLARVERIIKETFAPVVRGDFRDWAGLRKYEVKAGMAEYERITGKKPIVLTKQQSLAIRREEKRRAREAKR